MSTFFDDEEMYFEPEEPGDKVEWATNNVMEMVFRFVGEDQVFYLYRDYDKLTP